MKPWRAILLSVGLLLTGTPAHGQKEPSPPAGAAARARAILADALKAAGGRERLDQIRTLAITGETIITSPLGPVRSQRRILLVLPDRLRVEVNLPGLTLIQGFDGKTGWISGPMGVQELPPAAFKEVRSTLKRLTFVFYRTCEGEGVTLSYKGTTEWEGKSVDVVHYADAEDTFTLFFDSASHRLVRLAYQGRDPFSGASIEAEDLYFDYREVSGVVYPFRTVTRHAGKTFSEFRVSELALNHSVDDAVFKKP
ncbi:MAG TPA: hypothetical protein VNM72_06760 [Blastocatellia bacterium]|nr:hypothetical protein [Blastocatellia bacterium]